MGAGRLCLIHYLNGTHIGATNSNRRIIYDISAFMGIFRFYTCAVCEEQWSQLYLVAYTRTGN
jgi:hypothetical protein